MVGLERSPRSREQVRAVTRTWHHGPRTAETYWYWIPYSIQPHELRHDGDMGQPEVGAFVTWFAA